MLEYYSFLKDFKLFVALNCLKIYKSAEQAKKICHTRIMRDLIFSADSALREIFFLHILSTLLKVHKIENFFDSDFGICVISLLVMTKY
jgi:hypothetical protein